MLNLQKFIVFDVETDRLYDPTTIHCIVARDEKDNEYVFERPTESIAARLPFIRFIQAHPEHILVGHNVLGFDRGVLLRFFPSLRSKLGIEKFLDTLIISRLLSFQLPGGHSLEAWGERVGEKKEHAGIKDFTTYTPEMLARCRSDVRVNVCLLRKLWRYLVDPEWEESIRVEHFVADLCLQMSHHGLPFDYDGAVNLHKELSDKIGPLDEAIQKDFPPRLGVIRTITPRLTKKGTLNAQDFRWAVNREWTYDPATRVVILGDHLAGSSDPSPPDLSCFDGEPFDLCEWVEFNPASPQQVVDRLNEAGWKPTDKTKGHIDVLKSKKTEKEKLEKFKRYGWKVNEENLKTLPDTAPAAARYLSQRIILSSRISDLNEWIECAVKYPDGTYKIHGQYMPIGSWTHRLAHMKPNTANIPVAQRSEKDSEFESFIHDISDKMRALFIAGSGKILIGTDADGIQMRIFAHLVGDERLIEALVNGSKDNGTDIHSLHMGFLGSVCKARSVAKTFIYAFLLGAGIAKVAEILECSFTEAKKAVDNFLEAYPGLKKLKKEIIPRDAKRGYFIGLDGRKVVCESEHLMLAGYLQNGEKVIMARAARQWMAQLDNEAIRYAVINWVHDEWQTLLEDNTELREYVQKVQIQAIRDQGDQLHMLCPLEGTSDWGYSWKDTH